MIEAQDLTKVYGGKTAVDHLSFTVEPGRVTGFLGPNGAGKSTTMRMILGLDRPQSGFALINGRRYRDLKDPLHTVGALLEAKSVHPGRSARNHLLFLAQTQGIPASRVEEVLALVGLQEVADKRAGGFSLGMSQRLGVAVAMLGNPEILLLDEPVNGLDPEGVLWIRNLMKSLAAEGRTVLVSSHLMNEMAVTADHLIVIGRGRLITEASTEDVIARSTDKSVRVRTPHADRLAEMIAAAGGKVVRGGAESGAEVGAQNGAGLLTVTGLEAPRIGELAASASIVLHELTPLASLEGAFMELTSGSVEFGAANTAANTEAAHGSTSRAPRRLSRSTRGRYPRADAADALDGVAHQVAGPLRRRERGVRGHVDLRQAVEQVPCLVARLDGGPRVQHRVRIQEGAGHPRRNEGQHDPGVSFDVAQLRVPLHMAADEIVAVQPDPDDAHLRASVGVDRAQVGERAGLDQVPQLTRQAAHSLIASVTGSS
jgi:ABC-2 type transport system ATP-binding protein